LQDQSRVDEWIASMLADPLTLRLEINYAALYAATLLDDPDAFFDPDVVTSGDPDPELVDEIAAQVGQDNLASVMREHQTRNHGAFLRGIDSDSPTEIAELVLGPIGWGLLVLARHRAPASSRLAQLPPFPLR
jgi:hypothetical protein